MVQQGQTFELRRRETSGERLWAYRYHAGSRDSKRVQHGGFASEQRCAGCADGREHAIKLLDALNAPEFEPWTLVDAAWTSKRQNAVSADNRKAEVAG
jgi:hypothetical protein